MVSVDPVLRYSPPPFDPSLPTRVLLVSVAVVAEMEMLAPEPMLVLLPVMLLVVSVAVAESIETPPV